ncbi:hypothetical protein R50073_30940 [Maricurvus nonylphenolicus]|uniref:Nmad3 family putative nucleotide modification protein n=1 Tax=Maricurvus nonylphenolicus TaxID=1008307 RepID=UPI0036F36091
MKIIFSRKGFDSSSGGCPNPILPDGSLMPLPIPDQHSPISYGDITDHGINLGEMVNDLTKGKITANNGAHLDPDVTKTSLARKRGWQAVLGQHGSAQGHLTKQGVTTGDLFLFFGLFQPVIHTDEGWRFDKQQKPRHMFWGWLQIGASYAVSELKPQQLKWAHYHPHFFLPEEKNNTLYIAAEQLQLSKKVEGINGAGLFNRPADALQLTAPDARTPSQWQVPAWLYPSEGKIPLSYHHKMDRWQQPKAGQKHIALQGVARGQEFVLDTRDYPQAKRWALNLIKKST